MVELNAFFLKDLLWVPPESPLNVQRLLVWALIGAVAIRDYYHFMENPTVKR
jgi:phosphatidylserine synthase 2